MSELFEHLDRLRNAEGKVALATLVNTRGTTPRKEGAKMVVGEGGSILGSVTIGGCVDAQVIEQAEDAVTTLRPRLLGMNLGDGAAVGARSSPVWTTAAVRSGCSTTAASRVPWVTRSWTSGSSGKRARRWMPAPRAHCFSRASARSSTSSPRPRYCWWSAP